MKHLTLPLCLALLVTGPALAVDTARPVPNKNAAAHQTSAAEQLSLAAEEQDRLAREKKEMEARAALLQQQLVTSKKLLAEKEAWMKKLQEEIKTLKADE